MHRAISFLVSGRADSVGAPVLGTLRSPAGEFPRPHVVRLREYVKLPNRARVRPWTREGVRRRDKFTCAYCGGYGNTVDHITPRAQGGGNDWLNTITACSSCNNRKSNRTPEEARMPLQFKPSIPTTATVALDMVTPPQKATLLEYGLLQAA